MNFYNIFGLSQEQAMINTKHNAYSKYGRKTSNSNFRCRVCRKDFLPKNSNASYKTMFCSMKCEEK